MIGQDVLAKIPLAERQRLLQALPLFAPLSPAQSSTLASLLQEISYVPGAKIVAEHDLVDSIYVIAEGEVEVAQAIWQRKKLTTVPVAVLHKGDSIGISDSGFYSTTGTRTATVTALTPTWLLRLDLQTLHRFLQEHGLASAPSAESLK